MAHGLAEVDNSKSLFGAYYVLTRRKRAKLANSRKLLIYGAAE